MAEGDEDIWNNNIEKKSFQNYTMEEDKADSRKAPLPIKLNEKDEEMIMIGRYAFNMESKGGVLKLLAEIGLREVILKGLGVEKWHYLTSPQRRRLIQEKPKYQHFRERIE